MTRYSVYVQAHVGKQYTIAADSYNQAKIRGEQALVKELYGADNLNHFDYSNFTAVDIEKVEG